MEVGGSGLGWREWGEMLVMGEQPATQEAGGIMKTEPPDTRTWGSVSLGVPG